MRLREDVNFTPCTCLKTRNPYLVKISTEKNIWKCSNLIICYKRQVQRPFKHDSLVVRRISLSSVCNVRCSPRILSTCSMVEYQSLINFRRISLQPHPLRRPSHLFSISWFIVDENITFGRCWQKCRRRQPFDCHAMQCHGHFSGGGGGRKCENASLLNKNILKATTTAITKYVLSPLLKSR